MIIGLAFLGISLFLLFLASTGSYQLLPPFLNMSGNPANNSTAQNIANNIIASSGGGSHGVK